MTFKIKMIIFILCCTCLSLFAANIYSDSAPYPVTLSGQHYPYVDIPNVTASLPSDNKLLAGYLDVSATASAQAVLGKTPAEYPRRLKQIKTDGYNTLIFAFANINGDTMTFHNAQDAQFYQAIKPAHDLGMKVLVSVGGQANANTFHPDGADLNRLADNIIQFVHDNHLDGIDFDLEVSVAPTYLDKLLQAIKSRDSKLLITGAPQLTLDKKGNLIFASNGTASTYRDAIPRGDFNYLFVQEYNTGGFKISSDGVAGYFYQCSAAAPACASETDIAFMSNSLLAMKKLAPSNTKIVIGEPVENLSPFSTTIYRPDGKSLSLKELAPEINKQIASIASIPQFGGIMGWSMNIDYDPSPYGPLKSDHTPGSFAQLISKCLRGGYCSKHCPFPK